MALSRRRSLSPESRSRGTGGKRSVRLNSSDRIHYRKRWASANRKDGPRDGSQLRIVCRFVTKCGHDRRSQQLDRLLIAAEDIGDEVLKANWHQCLIEGD